MQAPTLTTDRLILRALIIADWESYAAMWEDPAVVAFIGGLPRSRDEAWIKFGQAAGMWALVDFGNWAVIDRTDGSFLGVAGLSDFKRGIAELEGYPEAGWAFAGASWGRGIASEAIAAITRWSDAAGIAETRCMIDHGNIASAKVAARNGYRALAELPGARTIFTRRVHIPG